MPWPLNTEIPDDILTLDKATNELKPTTKEQWIQFLPKGSVYLENYKKDYDFSEPEYLKEMDRAYNAPTLSKPFIDIDHRALKGDSKSYGDILEIKDTEKGRFAKVVMTKKGKQLVEDGDYKYVSPTIVPTKDTQKNVFPVRLATISLTNIPALEAMLPDLQSQIREQIIMSKEWFKENKGDETMELERLIMALSLSKDSNIDNIVDAVKKVISDKTASDNEVIRLTKEMADNKNSVLAAEGKEFVRVLMQSEKLKNASEIQQNIVLARYIADPETEKKFWKYMPGKTLTELELSKANAVETGMTGEGKIVEWQKRDSKAPTGYSKETLTLSKEIIEDMQKCGFDPSVIDDVQAWKGVRFNKYKGGK